MSLGRRQGVELRVRYTVCVVFAMQSGLQGAELTDAQFRSVSTLTKKLCGINLHEGKKQLVRARLAKRLRALGMASFEEYMDYLRRDDSGDELTAMLDALSTNLTRFFREPSHFVYMVNTIVPRLLASGSRRLHVWSAGCSSGEEPYSIAIHLAEAIPDLQAWDVKILATDLSTTVLERAREGIYDKKRLQDVPGMLRSKHFTCIEARPERRYQVKESLRQLVHFARLNLMDTWPMGGPFEIIFCRNVMIYFDKPTQAQLVERFTDLLAPAGTLFIGHSESLTGVRHQLRYVEPTVYEKPAPLSEEKAA